MNILAVCRGGAERLAGKTYKTGINKHAINGHALLDREGIVGDAICNRKYHGGPEQAVYVEGTLTLSWWAEELGRDLPPGTFGENLVIDGLDNRDVAVGDRFSIGEVLLEVTSARIPCATFAAKMGDPGFVKRYMRTGRPGIYCRVLESGSLAAGQSVAYTPFSGVRITMEEWMKNFGKALSAPDRSRYLSAPIHAKMRTDLEAAD